MKDLLTNALLTLVGLLCVTLGGALCFGIIRLADYCTTLYPWLWYVVLCVALIAFLGYRILTGYRIHTLYHAPRDSQPLRKDSL